jgi:hypothetical protein
MSYMAILQAKSKDTLVNDAFNAFVSEWADDHEGHQDKGGKRIPYIGWFWRNTDFVNKQVSIGDAGGLIGVMENNKWGYPERMMTEQEVDAFIAYLERAYAELGKGGILSELHANAEKVFDELWDWFQTLEVKEQASE